MPIKLALFGVIRDVLSTALELSMGGMAWVGSEESDMPCIAFVKLSSTALELSVGGVA